MSYLGSTNVEVRKDETAEAAVICTINKAKVSVSYTDDFKKIFFLPIVRMSVLQKEIK